ncbi:hypothetical protein [Streptosporangium sp. KLBMP 9127]|nr:hypothetical protein [Streptosporangium sp. KLBMP 9127]
MEDEARLWALVEAAWASLGVEVNQARQALEHRTPVPDEELDGAPAFSLVDDALEDFLEQPRRQQRESVGRGVDQS